MPTGIQLSSCVICACCGASTRNKNHYCDQCQHVLKEKKDTWKRHQDQLKRLGKKRVYDTGFWRKVRKQVLQRDNYLCVMCAKQGRITPATDVDHIIPVAKGGSNMPDNLQSLCHECHKIKTSTEDNRK